MNKLLLALLVVTCCNLANDLERGQTATESCTIGSSGCPCDLGRCYSTPNQRLTCLSGYCVPETCVPGAEGCPCYANGSCDPVGGKPLACKAGLCAVDDGSGPVVTPIGGVGLVVGNAAARACDVVVSGAGLVDQGATFSTGIIGRTAFREPRLALSFISDGDVSMARPAAILKGSNGSPFPALPAVEKATCYDGLGHPLGGVNVVLEIEP